MKAILLGAVLFMTALQAQAQRSDQTVNTKKASSYAGNFTFGGSAEDYISGGIGYSFSEGTGSFKVTLSSDRRSLSVHYEDALVAREAFPRNWFDIEFKALAGSFLRPGKYTGAKRAPFSDDIVVTGNDGIPQSRTDYNGFVLGGNGRGCNELTADFEISKWK